MRGNHGIGGYEDRVSGVWMGQLRQRALKLQWVSTARLPFLRHRLVNRTKPIAPDTFKASHRRLGCLKNYSSNLHRLSPIQPGGDTRFRLVLVSSPLPIQGHVFRIFDRPASSVLRR
jgi:hypothetical protein